MSTPRVLASFDVLTRVNTDRSAVESGTGLLQSGASPGDQRTGGKNQAANLIESAMNRSSRPASNTLELANLQEADARQVWQREQDAALKLRLKQLQNAQQGEKPKAIDPPGPRPAPQPARAPVSATACEEPKKRISGTALWVLTLVPILVGIGLVWFQIGAERSRDSNSLQQFSQTQPAMANPDLVQGHLAPLSTAPVAAAAPQVGAADESARVRELVERWRQAWMTRDASAYLKFYSPEFVPTRGQSRVQWEAARRKALSRPAGIEIKVSALRIERLSDDQIRVDFLQDYAAGKYSEVAQPKSLIWVLSGTQWQIAREWQGAADVPALGAS